MSFAALRFLGRRCAYPGSISVHLKRKASGASAKATFKDLFARVSASKPKPKYELNSYGQTAGTEYPFDPDKMSKSSVKREKSKGTVGSSNVDLVCKILKENLAQDIKLIELPEDARYADYLIVASGTDTKHLQKMTHLLCSQIVTSLNSDTVHVEGLGSFDWMVVDAGNVVVHLFLPQTRAEYDIEGAWSK